MSDTSRSWILPPLRGEDRQFATPDGFGRWEKVIHLSALKQLAADLDADAKVARMRDLVSVPDCWGHLDTFRMALADEGSPLHAGTVVEWRGLLALFALSGRYPDIALRTTPVPLAATARTGGAGRTFASVLTKVQPPDRLDPSLTWETPVLILSGGRPVGLLSPSTLVAPGRQVIDGPASDLPWVTEGAWIDPATAPGLTLPDLACLHKFLVTLHEACNRTELPTEIGGTMLRELRKFSDAVAATLERRFPNQQPPLLQPNPLELDVGGQTFFANLKASFVPDRVSSGITATRGAASEVLIAPRSGLPEGFRGAVIMDPDLASALNRNADTIICWNHENLDRNRDAAFRATQAEDAARAGFIPLTFDDIFTPALCRISDRTCSGHVGPLENFLLPLRPLMTLLFDNDDLLRAVSLDRQADGYVVKLRLSLQGPDGTSTGCTIRRVYKQDAVQELKAPQAFLWPDFRSSYWSKYYVYRQSAVKSAYMPACIFTKQNLTERLEEHLRKGLATDAAFAASLGTPTQGAMQRLDVAASAVRRDLFIETQAPEAIFCTWLHEREEVPGGLLILPEWKEPSAHGRDAVVGIDFGTTNTCIYHAEKTERPKAAKFQSRVWWPYRGVLGETDSAAMDEDYFPAHPVDMPFRTLLRERNLGETQKMEPVIGARILFATNPATAMRYLGNDGNQRFHLDIKWAAEGQRNAMQCFLSQAVLMTMAEMVADGFRPDNVTLRFSYPEAFTRRQTENFTNALAGAARLVGMESRVKDHVPESLAAAYFFREEGVPFTQPVITIDVGGHTTDVSIWKENDLLWKGSLEIGGRDTLIRFLSAGRHQDFLNDLLVDEEIKGALEGLPDTARGLGAPRYGNIIETVVNDPKFANALRDRRPILSDRPEMITLRKTAEISFAGILWYLGCVVRRLRTARLLPSDPQRLTICLGGRGSLLFRQFSGPGTAGSAAVRALFAESAGLGVDTIAEFVASPASKAEVAAGLTRAPRDTAMVPKLTAIPLGEGVSAGTASLGPEDDIQALLDNAGVTPTSTLSHFKVFLAKALDTLDYEPYVAKATFDDLSVTVAERIKGQVELLQERDRKADDPDNALSGALGNTPTRRIDDLMRVQPPFVIALKEYIHKLAAGELAP